MGCGTLDPAAGGWDVALACGGKETTSEFLFFGFASLDCGHSEELRVDARVPVKDGKNLSLSSCPSLVRSVALLPEELAGAEEGLWVLEFPTDDRVPLVEFEWEIAVGANPFRVVGVHDGFRGWADRNMFFELSVAAMEYVN